MGSHDGTNYLHLPVGDNSPEEINVVVEIPQGSRNKYEFDKGLNVFRLDRALHSPIYYPGDYGFIPRTLAEDDDPLDVLILVIQPTFAGCLVVARPIGILKMIDDGKPDDKVLAVPVGERVILERRNGHIEGLLPLAAGCRHYPSRQCLHSPSRSPRVPT